MSSIVSGRSPFTRMSVCAKTKRKTWMAIVAIYVAAFAIAAVAINLSTATR